jgi:predicted Rossmann fold nucleotide-binding protein DprA/Smf involved in DNA uptake
MAIGIDGVALAAALAAGKPVVAVLGCGIDICYPKQHLTLAREIVKEGCVITEYPPHTPPLKHNFPKRNRIISGLSEATLVFEGRERSGAVITARYAKDQGRAVYALPGSVGVPNSEASFALIRNGARTFISADDIVSDFQDSHPGKLNPFLMKQTCPVDLMDTLRLYRVSALCPGDDVFTPPAPRRTRRERDSEVDATRAARTRTKADEPAEASDSRDTADTAPPPSFDATALRIYKKIPTSGDCTVDSLVDDVLSMREVSRALFKLELGSFVVRLPGERVMRKTK